MRRFAVLVALLASVSGLAACNRSTPPADKAQPPSAAPVPVPLPEVDGGAVLEHTKVLASNEYEGRRPGTRGEELTVAYISDQLRKIGIKPGNPDGTYVQKVPLVGITVQQTPTLTFRKGAARQVLKFRDDYVAWTKRVVDNPA